MINKYLFGFITILLFSQTSYAATREVQVYDGNGNLIRTETVQVPDPDPVEVAKASDREEFKTSTFKNMTPAEADQWIQNNVTDLASAKVALRKMSRVLMYLVRRSDL